MGRKKQAHYRIVVADSASPRDGRFVETLGYYKPLSDPARLIVDLERVDHWLGEGASPSGTVKSLISKARAGGDSTVAVGEVAQEERQAKRAEELAARRAAEQKAAAEAQAKVEAEAAAAAEAEAAEEDASGAEEGEAAEEPAAEAEAEPTAEADAGEGEAEAEADDADEEKSE